MIAATMPDPTATAEAPARPDPNDYLDFVRLIAWQYVRPGIDVRDLINEGMIGLMIACERYNPDRGFKFLTYARYWIRKFILLAMLNYHRAVPLKRQAYHWVNKLKKGEVDPTTATPRRRRAIDRAVAAHGWGTCRDGEDGVLLARLADGRERPTADAAVDRATVDQFLRMLPARERRAVTAQYGLDGGTPLSPEEAGRELGVSPQRVGQITRSAIKRIRTMSRAREEAVAC